MGSTAFADFCGFWFVSSRGDVGAALGQHVGIAAGVFGPAAVTFGDDDAGHDAVEEVAVMADEDDGAGVTGQHFLEHVQCFEIEVVGRLVEHEHVRGLGECAGEHEAAALTAGQHAQRCAALLGLKQEIAHVGDDVLGLSARS